MMENNILELECSEQPISVYQAIGLIDCNISAQGSGPFRYQANYQNDASRAIHSDVPILKTRLNPVCDHVKQSFSQGNER